MKLFQKLNRSSSHAASALALAGILALGMGGLGEPAIALPFFPSPPTRYLISSTASQTQPSQAMVNTLRQSLSKQTGIPAKQLRVVESSQKTWPNGCLGLAKADEMCTQMMVPGWRIVFSNGTQRWTYRTDATGRNYRLETSTPRSLMPVPEPSESSISLQPTHLSEADLPAKLQRDEVFRVVTTGGLMGQTRQSTLLKDGQLLRVRLNPDGTTTKLAVHRISSAQINQFQTMVQQYLSRFDRCNYPAISGSADFITVTMSSPVSTVRYADIVQNQLPKELQTIIQTWNEMERSAQNL